MSRKVKLSEFYKLIMINYGLDPNLTSENHGNYDLNEVLKALRDNQDAICFQGLNFDDSSGTGLKKYTLQQPFLFTSRHVEDEGHFQILPFDQNVGPINRFKLNLEDTHYSNSCYNDELVVTEKVEENQEFGSKGKTIITQVLDRKKRLKIAFPKRIPVSEIHNKLFEQIESMYGLTLKAQSFQGSEGNEIEGHTFSTEEGNSLSISTYKRKEHNSLSREIFLKPQDLEEECFNQLKNKYSLRQGIYCYDNDKSIEISGIPGQTMYLDTLIKHLI